jgi:hypothetical protein
MEKTLQFITLLALSLGLAACGGGSSDPASPASPTPDPIVDTPTSSTAQVTVLLTDAPSPDWDQAWATITSIEMIGDNGIQVIFSGSETVDLLSLPDFYDVFAIADAIEPDTFHKIRLHVEQLELVELNDDGTTAESVLAQLVGGGKIDLIPHEPFFAGPGDSLFIEIDFDVHKTFKTTSGENGSPIVRPVIKVEIRREEPLGRLTRLQGHIGEVDVEGQRFSLCQSELVAHKHEHDHEHDDDDRGCVIVAADELTGVFGADGMPIGFDGLEAGLGLTAIGHLRKNEDFDYHWHDHEDDGDKSNSDSSVSSHDDDDDDGKAGEDKDKDYYKSRKVHDYLMLSAVTIEVGEDYRRVSGAAEDVVMGDTFGLALEPGQNLGTEERVLATQLFELTRIFSKDGTELDSTAIEAGARMLVDGVLVTSETDPDTLRAALLILDLEAGTEEEVRRGEIVSVNFDAGTFQMLVDETEVCVNANDADIFLVSNVDGFAAERVSLGDLEAMQAVDVFGSEEDDAGCFVATDILAAAIPANTMPVADAGDNQTVTAGASIMLDGSASSDDDGDSLTYSWSLSSVPESSTAELAAADTAMPSFTADVAGEYVVELIVNDGSEDSAPDTVTITAE